jgi:hypothetical protein
MVLRLSSARRLSGRCRSCDNGYSDRISRIHPATDSLLGLARRSSSLREKDQRMQPTEPDELCSLDDVDNGLLNGLTVHILTVLDTSGQVLRIEVNGCRPARRAIGLLSCIGSTSVLLPVKSHCGSRCHMTRRARAAVSVRATKRVPTSWYLERIRSRCGASPTAAAGAT